MMEVIVCGGSFIPMSPIPEEIVYRGTIHYSEHHTGIHTIGSTAAFTVRQVHASILLLVSNAHVH